VLDVSGISELKGVVREGGFLRIGGLATWSEIIAAPLPRCLDALKLAAREIGGVQIQNRGTIAGNLCNASPAADGVPPLLALDAEVELTSLGSVRRMSLAEFITGNRKTLRRPDEILSCVRVPLDLENSSSTFLKLGARRYLVISIAMVAVVLQVDDKGNIADARIAVGSCSVTAQRLKELERDLLGARATPGLGSTAQEKHLSTLSSISDVRATADYRQSAALTLIERAINTCAESC
jgi:CO/xanthine dehydrogenase FAD-binding subunit